MSLSPLEYQEYEKYVAHFRERQAVKQEQEPIRAWKLGYVSRDQDGSLCFSPVSQSLCYRTVDVFHCACARMAAFFPTIFPTAYPTSPAPPTPHEVPGKITGCGFYAMRERRSVRSEGLLPMDAYKCQDLWLLEVDLYGRVVKCKYGYRAQKQRVLSIRPYFRPDDYVTDSELDMTDYQESSRFGLGDPWTVPSLARITPRSCYYRLHTAISAGYLLHWPSPAANFRPLDLLNGFRPPGGMATINGMTSAVITYGIPVYSEACLERAEIVAPAALAGLLGTEVRPYEHDKRYHV